MAVADPRRILITGSSGFVGRHLLPLLEGSFPGVEIFTNRIDVTNRDVVIQAVRDAQPDACIHLAAISALLAERGIERLTILHCDAQGAELSVLEQVNALLQARRVDWLFLSTHHHAISGDPLTHQRCLALLRSLGAQIEVEHDVQESFSGDGLICARFAAAPAGWRAPRISYNRASESFFRHPLYDLALARRE